MADVYLAYDTRADRHVVIKILKDLDCRDAELRQRFLHEGQLACRCSHPNIITAYETDEENGRPYIVMEYLQGESLKSLMQRGGIATQADALSVALQAARALRYLHQAGIVHRDVKPENIQVDPSLCAKLLDFGVARLKDSRVTQAGQIIGTLLYMAPEQVLGHVVTPAADIYAFGVLLFEMLTLTSPYRATTRDEISAAIAYVEPDLSALQENCVPTEIVHLISRCLQKNPADRYESFEPICEDLKPFVSPDLAGHTERGNAFKASKLRQRGRLPWKWIVAGVAGALVLVALAFFMARRTRLSSSLALASGDMVLVEGGTALLGRDNHAIYVPSFYIDRTEVSNRAYGQFCRENGRERPPDFDRAPPDLPVVKVSFEDARAFARWAGKRLPANYEWEKAARGTAGRLYPWGNTFRQELTNAPHESMRSDGLSTYPKEALLPVESLATGASSYGVLHMYDNVAEWVDSPAAIDRWDFEKARDQEYQDLSPPLRSDEPYYQIRGGSYLFPINEQTAPTLLWENIPVPARAKRLGIGFRCAKDAR